MNFPEAETRAAVVAEAMTWLGTPWHHNSAVKGAGCDCARFPLAVFQAVGLVPDVAVDDYPPDWALHRDEERYLEMVRRFGTDCDPNSVLPGDMLVWRFGRAFSHGAIVLDRDQVIHAYRRIGSVTIDDWRKEADLVSRDVLAFTFWSVRDGTE